MLTGLAQIHASLQALHTPNAHNNAFADVHNLQHAGRNAPPDDHGGCACREFAVTVYDPDTVSVFNVGRQLFYRADVGRSKAHCLVDRVNKTYGTSWRAVQAEYDPAAGLRPDIVVSCTDTAQSRRALHRSLWDSRGRGAPEYWLDCANLAAVGQVVLGQPGKPGEEQWPRNTAFDRAAARWKGQRKLQVRDARGGYDGFMLKRDVEIRLPCVTELFPELMDENFEEGDAPSCSLVEALGKQSLFVNRVVSGYALDLLWELIREGSLDNQGCFFNLRTRTSQPVPLKVWPVQKKRTVSALDGRRKENKKMKVQQINPP